LIYLDNASTTALDPRVLEKMMPYLSKSYGNPSSVHSLGREARIGLETAREHVAALFNARTSEIVFTSGGTEADAFALHNAWLLSGGTAGKEIVSTRAEHQAVLRTLEYLEARGAVIRYLPVGPAGTTSVEEVMNAVRQSTVLITLMHANNETGGLHDIRRIGEFARDRGVLFHTDTVQTAGKLIFDTPENGFDFACASAHKMHGPKGIGAVFVRTGLAVEPLLRGGAQERGRRAGTESVALAAGFGEAARLALEEREKRMRLWIELRKTMIDNLRAGLPHLLVNAETEALPSILSLSLPSSHYGVDGEMLLLKLDLTGLALSSGSACTAGISNPLT